MHTCTDTCTDTYVHQDMADCLSSNHSPLMHTQSRPRDYKLHKIISTRKP